MLIAGVSTRAAAESAARAGVDVTTFDAYADLDQHPAVHAHAVRRTARHRFSPHRAAAAAQAHRADAAMYLSNFDNHPTAVSRLGQGRALWGNTAAVLARVRDPFDVADALARRGFAVPAVARLDRLPRARIHRGAARPPAAGGDWMIKPRRSGGGRGVRAWRPGSHIPANCYLQSRIDGIAGSIVFVADGRKTVPLGVSRQLIGDPAFGATGFQYCGSILGTAEALFAHARIDAIPASSIDSPDLFETAHRLADAVTDEYGLIGVNGIDFIARAAVPWPIEINPRWCSSMELVERAYGVSVFGVHAQACAHRALPTLDRSAIARSSRCVGKAIVFSEHRLRARDTHAWLTQTDIRDIPNPGDEIGARQPICTVFAAADTSDACHTALVSRARDIYRFVAEWRTEAA